MKLVLCLMCAALTSAVPTDITFEKPRDPVTPGQIPKIFPSRSNGPQRYPLAVEAVLSVALKLQMIESHDGKQQNFLVSPLAVAGALGELMLGTRGELNKQIGVLLTLQELIKNDISNSSAAETQSRMSSNPATTVQQRFANPDTMTPVKGSGNVVSRFGTVSAQDASAYQVPLTHMRPLPVHGLNGQPGLGLHPQLGQLIRDLSIDLPGAGTVHPIANSSYLHTNSAFFMDREMDLKEPFVRAIKEFYNPVLMSLDFRGDPIGAQKTINDWGSRETGGLIKKFLPQPPPLDTAVIQAVAVHFRGAWQTPFIPEGTIPGLFQTSENTNVPVQYMRGSFEEAYYSENKELGLRLLAMPYSNFDCAMYVILPTDNNPLKFNVGSLVSQHQLSSKQLAELVGAAKRHTVNVMFPRLSLTGSLRLASALEKHAAYLNDEKKQQANSESHGTASRNAAATNSTSVNTKKTVASKTSVPQTTLDPLRVIPLDAPLSGASAEANQVPRENVAENVQIAFRSGESVPEPEVSGGAQETPGDPLLTLTGAATNSRFRISDIVQHIALEVNEAGTEAAAIAGSTVNYSGDVKNFKVNRPFLFFIRHEETNAILFWGTVVDPTA